MAQKYPKAEKINRFLLIFTIFVVVFEAFSTGVYWAGHDFNAVIVSIFMLIWWLGFSIILFFNCLLDVEIAAYKHHLDFLGKLNKRLERNLATTDITKELKKENKKSKTQK